MCLYLSLLLRWKYWIFYTACSVVSISIRAAQSFDDVTSLSLDASLILRRSFHAVRTWAVFCQIVPVIPLMSFSHLFGGLPIGLFRISLQAKVLPIQPSLLRTAWHVQGSHSSQDVTDLCDCVYIVWSLHVSSCVAMALSIVLCAILSFHKVNSVCLGFTNISQYWSVGDALVEYYFL